ncbi:diaminopimelate aminotransferase [Bacillus sp. TS-2]|nr:diaminopimelate aminotransferase [Bacillus sp. TS-2]
MKIFKQSDTLNQLPDQFFSNLVKKVVTLSKQYDDVINLGQGNPDQPTPPAIVEKLQQAAENPLYHKYSPFEGFSFLKEAVAEYYQREYGVELDPYEEVAVLNGTKTGLVEVSQCLLNPGDGVLMPDPGYPDYWSGVALAKAKMIPLKLLEENQFLPVFSELKKEDLQSAKMMFLNYPNNPTGAIATPTFFKEVIQVANEHHICVVHDFAYGAIGYDGKRPISFLQSDGAKDVGIEMMTLSKTFNMAGWRVGFAVGNRSVIKAIELLQDHYYCSIFGGIQEAAAHALLHEQDSVQELVVMYEARRNVLVKEALKIGWEVIAPKGSFFAWFKVPKPFTSEQFADILLKQAHVVVAPGVGFGQYGEGYVRIGLLTDENTLKEAIDRMKKLNIFH